MDLLAAVTYISLLCLAVHSANNKSLETELSKLCTPIVTESIEGAILSATPTPENFSYSEDNDGIDSLDNGTDKKRDDNVILNTATTYDSAACTNTELRGGEKYGLSEPLQPKGVPEPNALPSIDSEPPVFKGDDKPIEQIFTLSFAKNSKCDCPWQGPQVYQKLKSNSKETSQKDPNEDRKSPAIQRDRRPRGCCGYREERRLRSPTGPRGVRDHQHIPSTKQNSPAVQLFQTSEDLYFSFNLTSIGTIALVTEDEQLFIRVKSGWKNIQVSNFVIMPEQAKRKNKEQAKNEKQEAVKDSVLTTPKSIISTTVDKPINKTAAFGKSQPNVILPLSFINAEPQIGKSLAVKKPLKTDVTAKPLQTVRSKSNHFHCQHRSGNISKIHLIALNAPYYGLMIVKNTVGIRGADLACYLASRRAGYQTPFRALLTASVQELKSIVHKDDHDALVVNLRNETLYTSFNHLLTGLPSCNVPIYSFTGRNVYQDSAWPAKMVWHGADSGGTKTRSACHDWFCRCKSCKGKASPLGIGLNVIKNSVEVECSSRLAVLCIEVCSFCIFPPRFLW